MPALTRRIPQGQASAIVAALQPSEVRDKFGAIGLEPTGPAPALASAPGLRMDR